MNENLAKITAVAKCAMERSDREIILYDRFNAIMGEVFKTLTGKPYDPEYISMYPKTEQTFLESARELFNTNLYLTDVTGANERVQLLDYSEKALAVVGDTKSIKDKFRIEGKAIGRFNRNLKVKGESVAGWIFPKKYHDVLAKIVQDHNTFHSPLVTSKGTKRDTPMQKDLFPGS